MMRISEKGITLIKEFEGCSLTAYPDPGSTTPGRRCGSVFLPG